MSKRLGPSPAKRSAPNHTVVVSKNRGRCTVSIGGTRIADSRNTLAVDETGYDRVTYFPPEDVRTDLLSASDSRSTCPFKGEASYFAAESGAGMQDVAWFYHAVYDEVAELAGHIAFYSDRVDLELTEDEV